MNDSFVLISKDAMCTDYLPVYGNKYNVTPNIDELGLKGTIFFRHYCASPSTVMSFYSMATQTFSHTSKYELYEKICEKVDVNTVFKRLKGEGYECHLVWDEEWMVLLKYYDYFGDDVKIHPLDGLRQGVGSHYFHEGFLKQSDEKKEIAWNVVKNKLDEIFSKNKKIFLWIHFPHVINGFTCYGEDIEFFDKFVGLIRDYVDDNHIAITADHGNQNGHRNKIGYGFDVYDESIRIPLITPRIDDKINVLEPTSSVDLFDIIFGSIKRRDFIYCDTAYRAQKHRRIAIINGDFKYVFDKKTGAEYLYDLNFDPQEKISIMNDYFYDVDRKINAPLRELYYYPRWDELPSLRQMFRDEKNKIWKNGSFKVVLKSNLKDLIRPIYSKIKKRKV